MTFTDLHSIDAPPETVVISNGNQPLNNEQALHLTDPNQGAFVASIAQGVVTNAEISYGLPGQKWQDVLNSVGITYMRSNPSDPRAVMIKGSVNVKIVTGDVNNPTVTVETLQITEFAGDLIAAIANRGKMGPESGDANGELLRVDRAAPGVGQLEWSLVANIVDNTGPTTKILEPA